MSLNDFIRLHLDLINLNLNNKKSKECLHKNCNTYASFNYKNYLSINIRKCIYCKIHKINNMINITDKKCITCNIKLPSFNYKNKKIALYCKDCKLENMVDIKSKKCNVCKIKRPNFNFINEKGALYCGDCKLNGMIDIKHKKCIICNIKIPCYNYNNEKNALYCGDCKLENMINIKDKKCILCLIKIPCYNYENKLNALYCGDCKLTNMINIKSKLCVNCNNNHPSYNYENEKTRLYCFDCKLENMVNISSVKCKTYLCDTQISNNKYKGYCLRCFINIFPDSKIIRDYGTREAKVTEFIKVEFKGLNIIYNKQIQGGCSDHRPDIFIDCLTHSVIIEVDEHQHKRGDSYSTRCEIRRVNELFTSLADRPIIFIRFNPDSYTNSKNKLIKSCFDSTEKLELPKANKTLTPRLNKLKEEIEKNINEIPNINITIVKLFYDGY
jgi:hypothetical protein